ncbi:hypothetical protein LEWO105114_09215 [Legionella worsleiensis]|nr:Uncharacterised protein [Legionella worsleiensis]
MNNNFVLLAHYISSENSLASVSGQSLDIAIEIS